MVMPDFSPTAVLLEPTPTPEIVPTQIFTPDTQIQPVTESVPGDADVSPLQDDNAPQAVLEDVTGQEENIASPPSFWTRSRDAATFNTAHPSSASYQLDRSVMAMGGGVKTSASYQVHSVSGQTTGVDHLQSTSYQVYSGYWGPGSGPVLVTLRNFYTVDKTLIPLGTLVGLALLGIAGWQVTQRR
jgi:hypothetical protein